ncbi:MULTISPECIES: septum formation family protein [unclassified Nocardioides]|uniref:septum formation family protein n=1 Tax=unclassified Nocardioides TaxID=2615069 RepID=UPI000AC2BC28|nr:MULTISPECIES: septum formation family protein [unclassified Nocardioides]
MKPLAVALASAVIMSGAVLAGCSGDDSPSEPSTSAPTSATASSSPSAAATRPQPPRDRACYRLDYTEAVAPTVDAAPVSCERPHTSMTYAVGQLDTVVDGHLLAVDSARVRTQVAATCPERFAAFVGGTTEDRRLSMLRPVWFTPTVDESDAGASWFRCDAVALAADEELAPLTGRLQGVLGREDGRNRYAMCGTAAPGTPTFERVICSADHSWRAVATVPFDGDRYPGVEKVRTAGDGPCKDAGADAANGELDYKWGYEWPTAKQWAAGQHYGLCWAPD